MDDKKLKWAEGILGIKRGKTRKEIDDYLKENESKITRYTYSSEIEEAKKILYAEADRIYNDYNDEDNRKLPSVTVKEDIIDWTNVPKPRNRNTYETDEEYVDYLKNYYESIIIKMSKQSIERKKTIYNHAKEEYERLKKEYDSIANEYSKIILNNDYTRSKEQMASLHYEYGQKLQEAYSKLQEANLKLAEADREIADLTRNDNNKIENKEEYPLLIEEKNKNQLAIEDKQNKNNNKNKDNPTRTLDGIMDDLLSGLEVKQKDNKRYTATNIKVTSVFKNKVCQGNYLYNLVGSVSSVIAVSYASLNKFLNKIKPGNKEAQERIEALEERINSLDENSLMVIYNEYRGTRMNDFGMPDIVNTLLGKKISSFVQNKVATINLELTSLYSKINTDFHNLIYIEKDLSNESISVEKKIELQTKKELLIKGKASDIRRIRTLQNEANQWFSGGEHGFAEDMKAARNKMSIVGYRFAKKHDLDLELLHEQRILKDKEQEAIDKNNDELAFESFMGYEKLQMDNTKVKNSIFGKRSVGERYYSPLVSELEYKDDPFIRDLFTTIAVVGSAVNVAGNIMEHMQVSKQVNDYNSSLGGINSQFKEAQAKVNDYGSEIASKQDTLLKGQEASLNQGELAGMNSIERMNLDNFGWGSSGIHSKGYKEADALAHSEYNTSFDNVSNSINEIANRYGQGKLSPVEAMEEMTRLQVSAQNRLTNIYSSYQPIIAKYAENHPNFDLHALEESLNNLVNNSNALGDASKAEADIMNIANELQNLTIDGNIEGIKIAQSMIPTIIGATSAFALAANVATSMTNMAKKGKYGNEITEMISSITDEELKDFSSAFKH